MHIVFMKIWSLKYSIGHHLSSADSRRIFVSESTLPVNSVARMIDSPDMTIAIVHGHKALTKTNLFVGGCS